jgi:hypothetical protein
MAPGRSVSRVTEVAVYLVNEGRGVELQILAKSRRESLSAEEPGGGTPLFC